MKGSTFRLQVRIKGDSEKLGNNRAFPTRSETYDLSITSSDIDSGKLGKNQVLPSFKSNLPPPDYSSENKLQWRLQEKTRKKKRAAQ